MNSGLNWFERYMLKRTIRKMVLQGRHEEKILTLYSMITCYARSEYTEDNKVTLDHFLRELFEEALRKY